MSSRKRPLGEASEGAPKKRGRPPKTPAAAAAPVPTLTREQWEAADERLLAVTKLMMFAAGDSNEPIEANARMLLALMQQQLRLLWAAASERAHEDGRSEVSLRDVIAHFARHKLVMGRLLNYAMAAASIGSIARQTPSRVVAGEEEGEEGGEGEEKEQDGVPLDVEDLSEGESSAAESADEQPESLTKRASRNSTYMQLANAIDSLQTEYRSADLTDPSFTDLTREARGRRMATRVRRLREDVYLQFTDARQAAYVTRQRLKRVNGVPEMDAFLGWLGLPLAMPAPISFVLVWTAKEIVTQVVDDAYMGLLKEMSSGLVRARGNPAASRLAPRHYSEALRKNLGWRTRGDILAGYIPPSE